MLAGCAVAKPIYQNAGPKDQFSTLRNEALHFSDVFHMAYFDFHPSTAGNNPIFNTKNTIWSSLI